MKVKKDGVFDLGPYDIEISLLSATIHLLLEMSHLWLEAYVSETPITNYIVACYSARQGWFPQQHDLVEE